MASAWASVASANLAGFKRWSFFYLLGRLLVSLRALEVICLFWVGGLVPVAQRVHAVHDWARWAVIQPLAAPAPP